MSIFTKPAPGTTEIEPETKKSLSSLVQEEKVSEPEDKKEEALPKLSIDVVRKILPNNLASAVTQEFVDKLNVVSTNQMEAEIIRENFINYTGILQEGKYKTEDYLNAIKYVSFKLMGHSNEQSYVKTFPERYNRLISIGTSKKDISSYVAAYAKNKLVNKILEQSLVPTWLLNQDLHQKAINHLAFLMENANSEKVQSDSANALLTHLAKPKEVGPLVNIDMRDTNGLSDLKSTLASLAQKQLELIDQGVTAKDIAAQKLVVEND